MTLPDLEAQATMFIDHFRGLQKEMGDLVVPSDVLSLDVEVLKSAGLSRQKVSKLWGKYPHCVSFCIVRLRG